MIRNICIYLLSLSLIGCITIKPKDFTYLYQSKNTGLDRFIDINGYYISQRGGDSTLFSVFMFYPDGLFTLATTSDVQSMSDCFTEENNSNICEYPSWGTYRIYGDTIKTQTILIEGMGTATIFRDYLILKDRSIVNISDYVIAENTNLGYMRKYPSYKDNINDKKAQFIKTTVKRNSSDCPYLNKAWFLQN